MRRDLFHCSVRSVHGLRCAAAPEVNRVDRAGGVYSAGIIRDVSVFQRGEVRGHGLWFDDGLLAQFMELPIDAGVKMRFTHPEEGVDALGSQMAVAFGLRRDGDRVRCDAHFLPHADAVSANYILGQAALRPMDMGVSVAFLRDLAAEEEFLRANGATDPKIQAGRWSAPGFKSPDPANTRNLPHVRLFELEAIDFVEDPAANDGGLFSAKTKNISAKEGNDMKKRKTGLAAGTKPSDDPPVKATASEEEEEETTAAIGEEEEEETPPAEPSGDEAPAPNPPGDEPEPEPEPEDEETQAAVEEGEEEEEEKSKASAASKVKAATVHELSALPGSDDAFVVAALKAGKSLGAAKDELLASQAREIERLKASIPGGASRRLTAGVKPVATDPAADGSGNAPKTLEEMHAAARRDGGCKTAIECNRWARGRWPNAFHRLSRVQAVK